MCVYNEEKEPNFLGTAAATSVTDFPRTNSILRFITKVQKNSVLGGKKKKMKALKLRCLH